MSMIDGIKADLQVLEVQGIPKLVQDQVKLEVISQVKVAAWKWYHENEKRVLVAKKILFINLSLKVKNLKFVFEELFGVEGI